jgi:hypothetical protein
VCIIVIALGKASPWNTPTAITGAFIRKVETSWPAVQTRIRLEYKHQTTDFQPRFKPRPPPNWESQVYWGICGGTKSERSDLRTDHMYCRVTNPVRSSPLKSTQFVRVVVLLTCTRKMPGSNLGRNTGSLDWYKQEIGHLKHTALIQLTFTLRVKIHKTAFRMEQSVNT